MARKATGTKDDLTRYREKRNFSLTPEPEGKVAKERGQRYLIQKHAATRLHYDFRLELDGVLKSWAVTRGPSLDPHDRRLAVEVEDHPVAYGHFEGTIPKGQYGGGTVMLWDEGTWEPVGDAKTSLAKGKLDFIVHGERLKGEWTLVRMKDRPKDKGRHNWLLIKRSDAEAKPGKGAELVDTALTSVASGRTMEAIAAAKGEVWRSGGEEERKGRGGEKKGGKEEKGRRGGGKKEEVRRKKVAMPKEVAPQLATLVDAMPRGEHWVHEVKFDGYRMLAYLENGRVRMLTRNGNDWTSSFGGIVKEVAGLKAKTAILDGEVVAMTGEGVSSFKALQEALSEGKTAELHYYAFDLLYLDGEDLRGLPLLARKEALAALLAKGKRRHVFYSEHFTGKDESFLQQLCGLKLEGAISKLADAPYRSGRGRAWVKTKCHRRQEFVIGGFTQPTHKERGIGALLIGYYEEEQFVYAGKVGTGFDQTSSRAIRKKLDGLVQKAQPFEEVPGLARRGATWVKPQLVCEVEFMEWTPEGRLRHPSFQGLREDKPAKAITRDEAVHLVGKGEKRGGGKEGKRRGDQGEKRKEGEEKSGGGIEEKREEGANGKSGGRAKKGDKVIVPGIGISHPERVLFPGTEITKLDLARYYETVAPVLLPHVAGRPLSMVRCPEGAGGECFFQRHMTRPVAHVHEAKVRIKGRVEDYVQIKDIEGLVTLAQWGVIELHPWGCKADAPEKADRIIFDLDPDPGVAWDAMVEAAREVRDRMAELGLQSFLKTTGGKGLHIVVPIKPEYDWDTVKAFARAVAESMQADRPERYIATMSKAKRKGKIFVDYLRNDHTATAIAPYAVRAREGAPVAMPLDWKELTVRLKPSEYTLETVPSILKKRRKDPWAEMLRCKQGIKRGYLKALGIG